MIPPRILQSLQRHLGIIRQYNAEVYRCRQLERLVGSSGRYEWEYRTDHEAALAVSLQWLEQFEARAQANGVDLPGLYAEHGGKPEVEPWSFEAQSYCVPPPCELRR